MRRTALLAALVLACACRSRVRLAQSHVDNGALEPARELLLEQLHEHPDDTDALALFGDIELRQGDFTAAKSRLDPILRNPDLKWRVSQVYRDAVKRMSATGDPATLGAAAAEAVRLNPLAADDMCTALTVRAKQERGKSWRPLIMSAVNISGDCRRTIIALLRNWIDDVDVKQRFSVDDVIKVARTLNEIDPEEQAATRREMHAATDKVLAQNRSLGEDLYGRLYEIDGDASADPPAMTRVATIHGYAVLPSSDKESPADFTVNVLNQIGALVTAYAVKNNTYPATDDIDDLFTKLRPSTTIDPYDGWSSPIHYASDGKSARLISAGGDREFGNADDIVWQNGAIVQAAH